MVPFTPPKSTAFKQFVILDHDGVVAALSALDGGQIDEILMRSADERGGSIGGEIDAKVAKGRGKRNKDAQDRGGDAPILRAICAYR